ncbi:hypothetical protein CJ204_07025 [Corynebacterium xerosis]|uniref:HTH tetR-type domain-containing protein n=1 Tax=Corynebacterium xerosis TaxID=1725 RepID=A0A2N6SYR9_9CORY|nr:TetR family transcriptional regulator [Corynebacterium xerosis]PMC62219.1 hypothetical protein CJ204_07025 [Corynebacterium xerosis]
MTGLREQKKRRTRLSLATAAVELLICEGDEGATVAAIAARAGVSTRTFHNYFAAREDAFLFFLEETIADWVDKGLFTFRSAQLTAEPGSGWHNM